ncbi:MAG: type II toxin-antitoxin system Phd/YefM family antitoxin [Sedimenticola sp.]
MRRLIIDQDIRPMSEFRSGVASFIKQVHETKRPLVITQHGKGVGVLLDVAEYEAMREKIELLEDIQTSITQISDGKGINHEDAKNMVLSRLEK